jgi:hypothetical protein
MNGGRSVIRAFLKGDPSVDSPKSSFFRYSSRVRGLQEVFIGAPGHGLSLEETVSRGSVKSPLKGGILIVSLSGVEIILRAGAPGHCVAGLIIWLTGVVERSAIL